MTTRATLELKPVSSIALCRTSAILENQSIEYTEWQAMLDAAKDKANDIKALDAEIARPTTTDYNV